MLQCVNKPAPVTDETDRGHVQLCVVVKKTLATNTNVSSLVTGAPANHEGGEEEEAERCILLERVEVIASGTRSLSH